MKKTFLQDIFPLNFEMQYSEDREYGDYWSAAVNIESMDKPEPFLLGEPLENMFIGIVLRALMSRNLLTGLLILLPGSLESANYPFSL